MFKIKHFKIWTIMALCLVAFFMLPSRAFAASRVNVNAPVSLTLHYQYDTTTFPAVNVKIYKVADISDTAEFTLSGSYAKDSVKVNGIETFSDWNIAAQTLYGYTLADNVSPTAQSGQNVKSGTVSFPNLKTGLYLIVTSSQQVGNITYSCSPFLLSLPNLDPSTQDWIYDVISHPKTQGIEEEHHKTYYYSYSVIKQWDDFGNEQNRPGSVSIEILKDGTEYQTVDLSDANDWSYTWNSNDDSDWRVVEKNVPSGYQAAVTSDNGAYVVTNTHTTTITNEKTPTSGIPGLTSIEDEKTPKALWQTGQLWWPVPLFAVIGLVLFGIGWVMASKDKEKHEK